nr:insulinase family protein [Gemmatimonadota bacterium]
PVDRVEALINEEIEKVRRNGVTADELNKARNRYRARTVFGRQTALGRAEALQYFAHFHGEPAAYQAVFDRYMAVTRDDIRRVANQYLTPQNRAVVLTQPAARASN